MDVKPTKNGLKGHADEFVSRIIWPTLHCHTTGCASGSVWCRQALLRVVEECQSWHKHTAPIQPQPNILM